MGKQRQRSFLAELGEVILDAAIAYEKAERTKALNSRPIMGKIIIDWTEQLEGKYVEFTIDKFNKVSYKKEDSWISWNLSNRFQRYTNCPIFESAYVEGVIRNGSLLTARVIKNNGERFIMDVEICVL